MQGLSPVVVNNIGLWCLSCGAKCENVGHTGINIHISNSKLSTKSRPACSGFNDIISSNWASYSRRPWYNDFNFESCFKLSRKIQIILPGYHEAQLRLLFFQILNWCKKWNQWRNQTSSHLKKSGVGVNMMFSVTRYNHMCQEENCSILSLQLLSSTVECPEWPESWHDSKSISTKT